MGTYKKNICPCCGKRSKHVSRTGKMQAYCTICHRRYQKVHNRERRERAVSPDNVGGAAPLSIPPEVYDEIRRRGWDPEKIVGLTLAILLVRTGEDRRPSGQIRHCLKYGGKKIYY